VPESVPIHVPALGADRAGFGLWLVGGGESVNEGDRVAEVLIPGACVDVIAPASGTLTHIAAAGDVLAAGDVVGVVS
jgi:pyruvate/2-oxoglutarate dehydrogenase complex dihydrolipoamide acyltransferase (E2) component